MQRQKALFNEAVCGFLAVGLLAGFAGCGAVLNPSGTSGALTDAGSDGVAFSNAGLGEESFDLGDLAPDDVRRVFVSARASTFDVAGLEAAAAGVPATDVMQQKIQDAITTLTTPTPEEELLLRAVDQALEGLFVSNLWILPTPGDDMGGVCSGTGAPCNGAPDCLPGETCLPAAEAEAARLLLEQVIQAMDQHIQDPTLGTPGSKGEAWDARNFLQLFQEAQQVIGEQTAQCDPADLRVLGCQNLLVDDEGGTDVDLVFPGFSRQVRSPFWIGASTSGIIQEQVIVPGVIAPGECSVVLKEIQGVKAIVRRVLIPIWVEPWRARARIVGFRVVWVWEFVPAEFLKTISFCNVNGAVVQDVDIRVVIERALLHFWSYLNKDITLSP